MLVRTGVVNVAIIVSLYSMIVWNIHEEDSEICQKVNIGSQHECESNLSSGTPFQLCYPNIHG